MTKTMEEQIYEVNHMGYQELIAKFEELYGFTPGNTNIQNLRARLIYRIQEVFLDGIAIEDRKYLEGLISSENLANFKPKQRVKGAVAGTTYERLWKGQKHFVVNLGDGKFEYNNNIYSSLSAIAREITGTRWNGKIFFGVK
jgi:hypothetical protein